MACSKETLMLISAYADDESTPQESARARAHLQDCANCRRLVEEWRGQLSVFEWAYTREIPLECSVEELERLAQKETSMTGTSKTLRLPALRLRIPSMPRISLRPAWTKAVALTAAAVVIGLGIHHIATRPTALEVGRVVASTDRSQILSMGRDITMRIGPGTKISRVDDNSVRLERGWVDISVRSRSGMRVHTERMEVVDQGTKFQVGTGDTMDYVTVEEGSVIVASGDSERQVKAGQILVARDTGEPSLAGLPREYTGNGDVQKPLGERDLSFVVQTREDILWREGLRKLSSRFPDAHLLSSGHSGISYGPSMHASVVMAADVGMNAGVYDHAGEIASVLAGGKIDSRGWEIPVCAILADGVLAESDAAADTVFYVHLVPKNGTIVWRLSTPDGIDYYMPLVMEKPESAGIWSGSNWSPSLDYDHRGSLDHEHKVAIWLREWPGELKPMLKLEFQIIEQPKDAADVEEMRTELSSALAGLDGFDPDHFTVLYLDSNLEHRFFTVWNREARAQLCRITDLAKEGRGGSAILGAFMTDAPLDKPSVGPGTYLVKFVHPGPDQKPHLEIEALGANGVAESKVLPILKVGESRGAMGHMAWAIKPGTGENTVRPDCAEVFPEYHFFGADRTGFPVQFKIIGRPDGNIRHDRDGGIRYSPQDIWVEGWIRIRKP